MELITTKVSQRHRSFDTAIYNNVNCTVLLLRSVLIILPEIRFPLHKNNCCPHKFAFNFSKKIFLLFFANTTKIVRV